MVDGDEDVGSFGGKTRSSLLTASPGDPARSSPIGSAVSITGRDIA